MKTLFIFLTILSFSTGCKKEKTADTFCTDGTIVWGGNPAADGLGWYIKSAEGQTYIPDNLPEAYQKDGLSIEACMYATGEKFQCHCVSPLDKYHITSINKK